MHSGLCLKGALIVMVKANKSPAHVMSATLKKLFKPSTLSLYTFLPVHPKDLRRFSMEKRMNRLIWKRAM